MRAYVVACGPSADSFDWGREQRGLVIACHEAARSLIHHPQFHLSADWVYWRDNPPRAGSIAVWVDLGDSPKNWAPRFPFRLLRIRCVDGGLWAHRWSDSLADGLMVGGCSPVAALNLADLMGADEVHLVGVDMCDDSRKWAARKDAMCFAVQQAERRRIRVVPRGAWKP